MYLVWLDDFELIKDIRKLAFLASVLSDPTVYLSFDSFLYE